MKIRIHRIVIVLLTISFLCFNTQAQQSDESRIRELKVGVKAMTDHPPPADAPDAPDYQRRVGEMLVQLQRLLLKKTGSLETRINGLQAAGTTIVQIKDQIAQLSSELRGTEEEIKGIDNYLARNGALPRNVPPKAEPEHVADDKGLSKEDVEAIKAKLKKDREEKELKAKSVRNARADFNEKVADVSSEALTEAALRRVFPR
jgi:hypothetical protein